LTDIVTTANKKEKYMKETTLPLKQSFRQRRAYEIKLETNMLGTVALARDIWEKYIKSKQPEPMPGGDPEVAENIEEAMERGKTGFFKDENGLFILEYMIKGFLKDSGNTLKDILGIKALKSKIDNFVFIVPRQIYFGKMEPDGEFERPIRVMTPIGQRVSIARSDYVNAGTSLKFSITLLKHKEITWNTIDTILANGQYMGLGQFRNGGFGRFSVTSVSDSVDV
jgi:hypothetical protein